MGIEYNCQGCDRKIKHKGRCLICNREVQRKRTYEDERGYNKDKGILKNSKLIHRQKAYNHIYKKEREKFPLKFSSYVIHHIDSNKKNNMLRNLYICTSEEHKLIHFKQKNKQMKFKTQRAISIFLGRI